MRLPFRPKDRSTKPLKTVTLLCENVRDGRSAEMTGDKNHTVVSVKRSMPHWTLPYWLNTHIDIHTHTRARAHLHKTQTHAFTQFTIAWNTVHWELQCVPSFCHSSDSELLSEYQKHFWSYIWCHIRATQSDVAAILEANPTGLYAFAAKITCVTKIFTS